MRFFRHQNWRLIIRKIGQQTSPIRPIPRQRLLLLLPYIKDVEIFKDVVLSLKGLSNHSYKKGRSSIPYDWRKRSTKNKKKQLLIKDHTHVWYCVYCFIACNTPIKPFYVDKDLFVSLKKHSLCVLSIVPLEYTADFITWKKWRKR